MPRRRTTEEKYQFYPTAEACADAATPIFEANRWRWSSINGIPDRDQILRTLHYCEQSALEESGYCSTGRLAYQKGQGFGHERPLGANHVHQHKEIEGQSVPECICGDVYPYETAPTPRMSARREGLIPMKEQTDGNL